MNVLVNIAVIVLTWLIAGVVPTIAVLFVVSPLLAGAQPALVEVVRRAAMAWVGGTLALLALAGLFALDWRKKL